MSGPLTFNVTHTLPGGQARVGRVETPHGGFDTPAFMPVGTKATVKGLLPHMIRSTGSQIILNNAYHLMLRPGDDLVARRGGAHRFMNWDGPILTDSGGYQAFSMADCNSINDDGVVFQSIIDGSEIALTPERSIEVQNNIGADIIMAFDDCPPSVAGSRGTDADPAAHAARLEEAVERTTDWLHRCVEAHARPDDQALFGIVQGGTDPQLRARSLAEVTAVDLPGYAIGGVAVGESPERIHQIVAETAPQLPADRPRYLMGVGYERDIVQAVKAGVDMFDCVLPTRNGRTASAFTRRGRINLKNARFKEDDGVIEPGCSCMACGGGQEGEPRGGYSRAYLRHLFLANEMLGPILVSVHNIHHFQALMLDIRRAIRDDAWLSLERDWPVLQEAVGAP